MTGAARVGLVRMTARNCGYVNYPSGVMNRWETCFPVMRPKASRILGRRSLDDLLRQEWRRALFIPAARLQPVTDELFVERGRVGARSVFVGRPEARAVGRQDFVDEDDLAVGELTPLELRVREQNALTFGVFRGPAVEREAIERASRQVSRRADTKPIRAAIPARRKWSRRGRSFPSWPAGQLARAGAHSVADREAAGRRRRRWSHDTPSTRTRRGSRAPRIRSGQRLPSSPDRF